MFSILIILDVKTEYYSRSTQIRQIRHTLISGKPESFCFHLVPSDSEWFVVNTLLATQFWSPIVSVEMLQAIIEWLITITEVTFMLKA